MALEVELAIRVLRQQPGMLGALFTHQRSTRPASLCDDLAQAVGVCHIHTDKRHPLLTAQRTGEVLPVHARRADPLIRLGESRQLFR